VCSHVTAGCLSGGNPPVKSQQRSRSFCGSKRPHGSARPCSTLIGSCRSGQLQLSGSPSPGPVLRSDVRAVHRGMRRVGGGVRTLASHSARSAGTDATRHRQSPSGLGAPRLKSHSTLDAPHLQLNSAKLHGIGAYVTKCSTVTVERPTVAGVRQHSGPAADAVTCRVPLGCASVRECPRGLCGSGAPAEGVVGREFSPVLRLGL
jgi:hypothetical protein